MTLAELWVDGAFHPTYFDSTYFDVGTQVTIRIYDIAEICLTKSVIHALAGKNQDFIQKLGKKYRRFRIRGLFIGDNRATNRATLRAEVNDYASFSSEGIPMAGVFITRIRFRERGSRSLEYDTEIECIEVIN